MKKLFACLLLLLAVSFAQAATVTGTLEDTNGDAVQTRITFDSLSAPISDPPNTIVRTRLVMTNDTDGTFSVTLAQGNYTVRINSTQVTGFDTQFNIYVPGGAGTYDLTELVDTVGDLYQPSLTVQDGSTIMRSPTNITVSGATISSNAPYSFTLTMQGSSNMLYAGVGSLDVTNFFKFQNATASRAAVFDANKLLTNSVTTATELGYLSGVTAPTGSGALVLGTAPTLSNVLTLATNGTEVIRTWHGPSGAFHMSNVVTGLSLFQEDTGQFSILQGANSWIFSTDGALSLANLDANVVSTPLLQVTTIENSFNIWTNSTDTGISFIADAVGAISLWENYGPARLMRFSDDLVEIFATVNLPMDKTYLDGTAAGSGRIYFEEDSDNGSNLGLLVAPAALTADTTWTLPDATGTLLTEAGSGAGLTAIPTDQLDTTVAPVLNTQRSSSTAFDLGDVSGSISIPWSTNAWTMRLTGNTAATITGSAPSAGTLQTMALIVEQDGTGGRTLSVGGVSMPLNPAIDAFTAVTVSTWDAGVTHLPVSTYGTAGSGESNIINSVDSEDFVISDRELQINGAIGTGGLVRESAAVVYQVSATGTSSNTTAFTLWSTNIATNVTFSAHVANAFAGGATNIAKWESDVDGYRAAGSAALFNPTWAAQILRTNYTAAWQGLHTNLFWDLDSNTLRLRAIGLAGEPMNWSVQGFYRETTLADPAVTEDANRLFYSNFEDSTDRAQWGALPSGWSDAYDTSPAPLFGDFSGTAAGATSAGWSTDSVDIGNTTGVIYARVAFRIVTPTASTGERIRIKLLDTSGSTIAVAALYNNGTSYYRIYAGDTTDGSLTAPASPVTDLNDGIYYLQLVYTRNTSVVATLRDASNNVVTGYTRTTTISSDNTVDEVQLTHRYSNRSIFDSVEVRLDDSWTTP